MHNGSILCECALSLPPPHHVYVCVCVCVYVCVFVCVYVCERETEKERERELKDGSTHRKLSQVCLSRERVIDTTKMLLKVSPT
jgi:hypothetical protein